MNRYAPPTAEITDLGPSGAKTNSQLFRNIAALVIGLPVGWLAVMESRHLVRITHGFLPSFLTGRYSIDVAEFIAALPVAVAVGALAYYAFSGTRRQFWWWALSITLSSVALFAIEPLLPDGSSRSMAIMSFLEFSSFLFIGLAASLLQWLLPKRHFAPAA
jgi:hypothetical protein